MGSNIQLRNLTGAISHASRDIPVGALAHISYQNDLHSYISGIRSSLRPTARSCTQSNHGVMATHIASTLAASALEEVGSQLAQYLAPKGVQPKDNEGTADVADLEGTISELKARRSALRMLVESNKRKIQELEAATIKFNEVLQAEAAEFEHQLASLAISEPMTSIVKC